MHFRAIAMWRILAGLALLHCAWIVSAQAQCNSSIGSEDYTVREVKLETLFGAAPTKIEDALKKHRGEKFKDDGNLTLLEYFHEIKDFFAENTGVVNQDRRAGINQQKSLYVKATFIKGCVKEVPKPECLKSVTNKQGERVEKCLDVTLKIKVVPIHTESISANLLDLARSNRVRFYRELPMFLRVFNPSGWIDMDREWGPTLVVKSGVDLLGVGNSEGEASGAGNRRLLFSLNGRKSLQESFYDATSSLSLSRDRPLERLSKIALNADFIGSEQPHADSVRVFNSVHIGTTLGLKLDGGGPFKSVKFSANYRHAMNRLHDRNGVIKERNSESAIEGQLVVDGSIAQGFVRGAVWFDGASISDAGDKSYRRLAATIGYAKEFSLPHSGCRIETDSDNQEVCVFSKRNSPRLGVEFLFGAGRAFGDVPEYAKFVGGNTAGHFLYDSLNEAAPFVMPSGPLIRSFGSNKAGVRQPNSNISSGATGYWHSNLTVALPLGALSRPLIPAELVSAIPNDSGHLDCSGCTSLKTALKNQVAGEKNIFIDAMAVRRMTAEQREDLALDPDDPDHPLTEAERARLAEAERVFERERQAVTPQADKLWERLTPTIAYIADHANLYAIRPIFMLDAARLNDPSIADLRTRLAVGGGIQFNVVVAKFELGYMRTVREMPGDQKGNFVIRMLFEKLF